MSTGLDHRTGLALLYAASAVACVLADMGGPSDAWVWRWAAVLLLALALVALLQLDQGFVLWARQLAWQSGWYAQRRALQALALVLAGMVARVGMVLWRKNTSPGLVDLRPSHPSMLLGWGMGGLLALTLLRFVSLHHTDLVLNWRVAGVSVGRLAELLGLGWVGLACGLHRLHQLHRS